ncbi:MAG: DUF11 domain-containing protein [Polyangiaceae bacterium]|nr:DUF11 domain-containing protein [Polyangiaceae bacterium]
MSQRRSSRRPVLSVAALLGALAAAAVTGLAPSAEAQQLRFSATAPGGIASTGNTLGLSKAYGLNGPGTQHSIGTFITLDPTLVDDNPIDPANPWPTNTTWDWHKNGSAGVLQLPEGATVLYAELVWAGSYRYGAEDVLANLEDPITLSVAGDSTFVAPDGQTARTLAESAFSGFAVNYYLRSADVTAFLQSHGAGTYAVEGVPATQAATVNTLNAAGWSLVVAYRSDAQPMRNLSVFVGGPFVDEDTEQDYEVSGFCAPPYGAVEGKVLISAVEGDANLTGDQLALGRSGTNAFVALSGPNNPVDNFFCSQVNDADGQADLLGTFGDANHDPFTGQNIPGGRQSWDLTTVPVSAAEGHLDNDQKSAVIRTTTTGDSFMPTLVAFQIDVKAPNFSDSTTESDVPAVQLGDTLAVTATLKNSGQALAANLEVAIPLESGLVLDGFAIDGTPANVSANALANGVQVGSLDVNETVSVRLELHVVAPPANGVDFVFEPTWGHSFVMCTDQPAIDETYAGPPAEVLFEVVEQGGAGGTPNEGGHGGSTAQLGPAEIVEEGSCGCQLPGRSDSGSGPWAVVALGAAAIVLARRRRS